jgi:hypothetical protein
VSGADLTDEVDRFVGGLTSDEDSPRTKRRRAATKALPPPADFDSKDDDVVEERDPNDDPAGDDPAGLLPRELPRPAESQRSLGSMMTKYRIGEDPQFRIQLWRLMPKWLPGGIQGHGYLEEYVHPITEEYIGSEFGGGTYEIRVLGPDPKGTTENSVKRYDSIKVEMAGAPNPERLARSVRAKLDAAQGPGAVGAPAQPQMMQQQENPGLATQALKMAADMAERERDERRRAEDKADANAQHARTMFDPVVEAERRRADDVLKVEREARESERRGFEERLRESRDEYRRLEAKVEAMNAVPQKSFSEELEKVLPMLNKGDGVAAAAAQAAAHSADGITKNILERHQIEVEAIHKQNQTMLESLRSAHVSEVASMRDANRREIETEREAGRLREQRHDETMKVEREERRRDTELYKRQADERDQQWRDRMEQQEMNLKVMWESRVETQKSNYESQLQWLRSEIDQLQTRVRGYESQQADRGDLVKQLSGMRDLRSVAKDALGIEDPPPPASGGSGGIGLSGAGADQSWQEVISTAIENLPAIWQTINGPGGMMGAPPPQQPQQQPQQAQPTPQPGQVIQTPQGPMVVVQAPNGQLALAPKDQYDAYQAQRTSRQVAPGSRPRGILGQPKPPAAPSSGLPVPDMSIGLPRPRVWGEPVQPPLPVDQAEPTPVAPAPPRAPQRQPRRGRPEQRAQQQGDAVDPKLQMLIAKEVAKRVHESVEGGDEPEEFVQKMLGGNVPPVIIQTIAGMTDEEVLAGIKAAEPNSAGTTPRGQRFVHAALAALRAAI